MFIFAFVQKLVSIFCLVVYFFTTTELYQFIKVPVLFEHYYAHKMTGKHLTFFAFLYDHYINSSDKNPDYAADTQLPFKTQDACVACNISSIAFIQQQPIHIDEPVMMVNRDFPEHKQPFLTYTFPSNIWQPPKSC